MAIALICFIFSFLKCHCLIVILFFFIIVNAGVKYLPGDLLVFTLTSLKAHCVNHFIKVKELVLHLFNLQTSQQK